MRKLTYLGVFQIGWVCFSFVILVVIALWEVKLDGAFIPTVVNGMSTVTGIFIALSSGLVVFTLNQRGSYEEAVPTFRKYRDHAMVAIVILAFASAALMMSYADLIRASPRDAVLEAMVGLYVAFAVFIELCFFVGNRVLLDIDRKKEATR
jgi:hypothetical protein